MNDHVSVKVDFNDGPRTINMTEKAPYEIEDCEEGKVVCLRLINADEIVGIFKGMDEDYVMLDSLSGKHRLGYKLHWIFSYLEELKS